jgi:hypothetical protein
MTEPTIVPDAEADFHITIPALKLRQALLSADPDEFATSWATAENNPDHALVDECALQVLSTRRAHNGEDHKFLVPVLHTLGKKKKPLPHPVVLLVSGLVTGGETGVRTAAVALLEKQREHSGQVWPDVASAFCDGNGEVVIAACQASVDICPKGSEGALVVLLQRSYFRGADGLNRGDDVRVAAVNALVALCQRTKSEPGGFAHLTAMAALEALCVYGYTCPTEAVKAACRRGLEEQVRIKTVPVEAAATA